MGNLTFDEGDSGANYNIRKINANDKPNFFEKIVIKVGLAKNKDGAGKVLVILSLLLLIVAGYIFYSTSTNDRKPVLNSEILLPLIEQQ